MHHAPSPADPALHQPELGLRASVALRRSGGEDVCGSPGDFNAVIGKLVPRKSVTKVGGCKSLQPDIEIKMKLIALCLNVISMQLKTSSLYSILKQ